MSYQPTDWKDRAIERPRTYTLQENADGTVTLVPVTGEVYEEGTPVIAAHMNKIEQGIADAPDIAIDWAKALGLGSTGAQLPPNNTLDSSTPVGLYRVDSSTSGRDGHTFAGTAIVLSHNNGAKTHVEFSVGSAPRAYIRTSSTNGVFSSWDDVITSAGGQTINGSLNIEGNEAWHRGDLRWNSAGYMEYNDGGTWRPVAIAPNKPRMTTYTNDSISSSTWYTALSINGQGMVNRISFTGRNDNDGPLSNQYLEMRINVDGQGYETMNVPNSSFNTRNSVGLAQRDNGSVVATNMFDYIGQFYFFSSIQIQLRAVYSGTGYVPQSLGGVINYSLV